MSNEGVATGPIPFMNRNEPEGKENPSEEVDTEPTEEEIEDWAELDDVDEVVSGSDSPASESDALPADPQSEVPNQNLKAAETQPTPGPAESAEGAASHSPGEMSPSSQPVPEVPAEDQTISKGAAQRSNQTPAPAPTQAPAPTPALHHEEEISTLEPSHAEVVPSPESPVADDTDESRGGASWGGWGGWSSFGASIKEAAAGAARDVKELSESFQQVIQEVTAEEFEEQDSFERPLLPKDPAASPATLDPAKKEVLERLRGSDNNLETGLKVCFQTSYRVLVFPLVHFLIGPPPCFRQKLAMSYANLGDGFPMEVMFSD